MFLMLLGLTEMMVILTCHFTYVLGISSCIISDHGVYELGRSGVGRRRRRHFFP